MDSKFRLLYILKYFIKKKQNEKILIFSNLILPNELKNIENKIYIKSDYKDVINHSNKNGLITEISKSLKFKYVIISQSKSKKETLYNLFLGLNNLNSDGKLIIEGHNKSGIKNTFRYLEEHGFILEVFSKNHGKIIIFDMINFLPKHLISLNNNNFSNKVGKDYLTLPGVFSEKGVDEASKFLASYFNKNLKGNIADIGSGWGYLSAEALKKSKEIKKIYLYEINKKSLEISKQNIKDKRAVFKWVDIFQDNEILFNFDQIICNPPFHKGLKVDFDLGKKFIIKSSEMLKKKGSLLLVANINMPYEKTLKDYFQIVELISFNKNFKIINAKSPIKKFFKNRGKLWE